MFNALMEMDSKSIRKRNMHLLISLSKGVKQFAEKVGTNPDYVSSLLSEKSKRTPGDQIARQIEQAFGLRRGWLDVPLELHHKKPISYGGTNDLGNIEIVPANINQLLADSEKDSAELLGPDVPNEEEQSKILAHDFVLVPRFDIKASMGTGQPVVSENVVDLLAFKRNWIQIELGVDPKNLALISTIGDSMEPTLRPGDLVLVDRSITHVRSGSVYVINFDGELMAKRMEKLFDGSLVIKSDNPAYATQTLSPEKAESLRIIGRVVWTGRRM